MAAQQLNPGRCREQNAFENHYWLCSDQRIGQALPIQERLFEDTGYFSIGAVLWRMLWFRINANGMRLLLLKDPAGVEALFA